ncbi:GAF domain-containing protein [Piptocephalis cylindrospora]|uniref:GAF domain-containing protein n=1 Tax=Piptocephalis cylindrospora TaxID=1907219 RepID=A0A4P9Y509_9FUNG|nr:GAF domain-containing protein [Piptocephalis cylindrospora]|eukprot:RKP13261.1 GAF domain-containing protein [Piptocephalis cylindrospora]
MSSIERESAYAELAEELKSLLSNQRFWVTNMSNAAAHLHNAFASGRLGKDRHINWTGFYIQDPANPHLLTLGPFQGQVACTHIRLGRGVCGTAAERRTPLAVSDVDAFPGHIACDSASKSEVVVPLIHNDRVLGVWDVDAAILDAFLPEDIRGIERLASVLVHACDWP